MRTDQETAPGARTKAEQRQWWRLIRRHVTYLRNTLDGGSVTPASWREVEALEKLIQQWMSRYGEASED